MLELDCTQYTDVPLGVSVEDAHGFILRRERAQTMVPGASIDRRIVAGPDLRTGEVVVAMTNVPHYVEWHSPSGYEWGYGGSGPADLALNIVEYILRHIGFEGQQWAEARRGGCFSKAVFLHQEFKWLFVATLPRSGGFILYEAAEAWVKSRL